MFYIKQQVKFIEFDGEKIKLYQIDSGMKDVFKSKNHKNSIIKHQGLILIL